MQIGTIHLEYPLQSGFCVFHTEFARLDPLGQSLPNRWVRAVTLISTGVREAFVTPKLATQLKLRSLGDVEVDQSGRLGFETSLTEATLRFAAAEDSTFETPVRAIIDELPDEIDAMLGMDLIEEGRFTIDGAKGVWRWELPGFPGRHTTTIPKWRQDDLEQRQKAARGSKP